MNPFKALKKWLVPRYEAEVEDHRREVRNFVHQERNRAAVIIAEQGETRKKLDNVLTTARNAVATLERAKRRRERRPIQ